MILPGCLVKVKQAVFVSMWMPVPTTSGNVEFLNPIVMREKLFLVIQSHVEWSMPNVHKPHEVDLIVWCSDLGYGRMRSHTVESVGDV